jgi:hypothetical protein
MKKPSAPTLQQQIDRLARWQRDHDQQIFDERQEKLRNARERHELVVRVTTYVFWFAVGMMVGMYLL